MGNPEAQNEVTYDTWMKPHDAVIALGAAFGL